MKRVFSMMVLTVLVGAAIQAQLVWDGTISPFQLPPKAGGMSLSVDPKSAIKEATTRYGTDIDNFMGVTDWSGVNYTNWFFFLGGTAGTQGGASGFQGGLAKKLGDSHLAVYFNGSFANGKGYNNGADDSSQKAVYGDAEWNDGLSILFGNPDIGGIRFNLLFNGTSFWGGENGTDESMSGMNDPLNQFTSYVSSGAPDYLSPVGSAIGNGPLITSLQWGKQFGLFTPKLTVGFRWPDKAKFESSAGTITASDHAQLGILLEAAYGDFSGDYQITVDFGPTIERLGQESTRSGYQYHAINLKYAFTLDVDEKLQFKLRPQLQFGIFNTAAEGNNAGTTANERPWGYFWFDPIVELGARYAFSPKVLLYSGINAKLLGLTRWYSSDYSQTTGAQKTGYEPSFWEVKGMRLSGGNLAVQLNPSERLSIELSLHDIITYGGGGEGWKWKLDFSDLSGGIAVVIKP